MSSELREYVNRIRYTRSYTFESGCGATGNGINDEIGNFDMLIDNTPFPQMESGQRAIFHLKSFYVQEQTVAQRASGGAIDYSGFFLQITGLGMEQSNNTTARACGRNRGNQFYIPNEFGQADNANSNTYQVLSGGEYKGSPILCSNPMGTMLNIKVYPSDTVNQLPDNVNLQSVIHFTIELIPDSITD